MQRQDDARGKKHGQTGTWSCGAMSRSPSLLKLQNSSKQLTACVLLHLWRTKQSDKHDKNILTQLEFHTCTYLHKSRSGGFLRYTGRFIYSTRHIKFAKLFPRMSIKTTGIRVDQGQPGFRNKMLSQKIVFAVAKPLFEAWASVFGWILRRLQKVFSFSQKSKNNQFSNFY